MLLKKNLDKKFDTKLDTTLKCRMDFMISKNVARMDYKIIMKNVE